MNAPLVGCFGKGSGVAFESMREDESESETVCSKFQTHSAG